MPGRGAQLACLLACRAITTNACRSVCWKEEGGKNGRRSLSKLPHVACVAADVEFGRIQARDLLQHLWTGPISNAPVEIIQASDGAFGHPPSDDGAFWHPPSDDDACWHPASDNA
eukprot:1091137-Pelagomonas_calceolata.AAC.3